MWESYEIFTLHFRITVKSMSTSANSWFLRNTKSAVISRSFAHHQNCASLLLCCFHLKIWNCLCNSVFLIFSKIFFSLFSFLETSQLSNCFQRFWRNLFIYWKQIHEKDLWNFSMKLQTSWEWLTMRGSLCLTPSWWSGIGGWIA